ncbi:smoothelin-like protein 2 [Brienomyrus brachyistius]|uniref:smoothelin-like protein 2 n=1 Tax=Brienomyrus brachyistius TaxID=42636 RepID=UPI0020B19EF2|nr:smoothelin-like protein 2 [Brienomyrus brachyistius]
MDAGAVAAHVEVPAEGETVCAALARCEATLRDAVRELHVDISVFKLGVERRLEEAGRLVGPLGPLGSTVAQLQQENRQLRAQLEALTRQVEALTGLPCNRETLPSEPRQPVVQNPHSPGTPSGTDLASSSPTAARFSSHACFAVSGRTSNPVEEEEPIEMDSAPAPPVLENGHSCAPESLVITQEIKSDLSDQPQEQVAPVAMVMPHLPITATTKIAESSIAIVAKTLDSPSSPIQAPPPVVTGSPPGQSTASGTPVQPIPEFPHESASAVKTWTPSPVRTMGSARVTEKHASVTAVAYPGISPISSNRLATRRLDVGGERRRDLLRSQTLPRNIGAQVRSPLEKLDSELGRPKLKRSQSFGVSSASSIKQVLLEWCRSKTIGYQNIDIQNFSSSWSDGLAFCSLVHSFFPTEFDYNLLSATDPRHNFELAFGLAEEKAGCDRLIEVEDMLVMGHKPDPMCIFTYVQSLYNHLRKFE